MSTLSIRLICGSCFHELSGQLKVGVIDIEDEQPVLRVEPCKECFQKEFVYQSYPWPKEPPR